MRARNDRYSRHGDIPGSGVMHVVSQESRPGGAERPGAAGQPARPAPPQPSRPRRPEPSWATVLATTVRLWAQRRLRWIRRLWAAQPRWRVAATVMLVAVVFLAGAATAALCA